MSDRDLSGIPIFPLNTVLFPDGVLQLRVFEQRYIEMTKSCLRDGTPFGTCLIREGQEVGVPAVPESVGCLARIVQWDMPQLGMFHLVARGTEPFRILESRVGPGGLISASVEMLPPDADAAVDEACRDILKLIVERAGADRFPAPLRLEDAAWISYRLAEVLPMQPGEKLRLLELRDPAARFRRLRAALSAQGLLP